MEIISLKNQPGSLRIYNDNPSMSVSMSCGAVSSQNNTYFTSSLAKTDSSPCTAKVTQQMILIYTCIMDLSKKIRTNPFADLQVRAERVPAAAGLCQLHHRRPRRLAAVRGRALPADDLQDGAVHRNLRRRRHARPMRRELGISQ